MHMKCKYFPKQDNYFILLPGLVTDGEFSSLRTQGETRPLHIWQLIHDARESVSRLSRSTLLKMLVQTGGNCDVHVIMA